MLRINDEYAGQTRQLTPDEVAHLVKELSEDGFATKALIDFVREGAVDKQLAYSVLYTKEARLAEFCKLLRIELDSAAERENRYADLRHANETIRRLEVQLGQQVSARHLQAGLKVLSNKLNRWWDVAGFGHIAGIAFTQYGGLRARFSCHLFSDVRVQYRDRPVSQEQAYKAWLEELRRRGFELVQESNEREPSLADSDTNRRLLVALFRDTFPSAKVAATANHYTTSGQAVLRDITVHVHKLEDVEALPEESESE